MPAFGSRPAAEQLDLVRVMVAMEANRIQRKITLTEDVVVLLLGACFLRECRTAEVQCTINLRPRVHES